MAKKPDMPSYLASPVAISSGDSSKRRPHVPGAVLRQAVVDSSEPSPAATEALSACLWPPVDQYLDEPDELSRWERIGEKRREASPATPDHGDPHFTLDQLVGAHLAEGYVGSVDLKTRVHETQEYASDTCVRREGIDPTTGDRYLEELVFEVVHKRSLQETKARAQGFAERGVRRQIGIFVKERAACEWLKNTEDWGEPLDPESSLEDHCLAVPLPLNALFEPTLARVAIARALETKNDPTILKIKRESEKRGEQKGLAESVLTLLHARGLKPSKEFRERILSTTQADTLKRWLLRAAAASSLEDVFDEV